MLIQYQSHTPHMAHIQRLETIMGIIVITRDNAMYNTSEKNGSSNGATYTWQLFAQSVLSRPLCNVNTFPTLSAATSLI